MTITTNTTFDTYNAAIGKWPLYTVEFDGKTNFYCNHVPGSPGETYKRYLSGISGLQQTVKPEKGQATIGGVTISLLDFNQEITALIAADANNMHRVKTIVRAGYKGMHESDLLEIATFFVTGLKQSDDGLKWDFTCTDPQKWLQKHICRNATEDVPIYYAGNAVNILLSILTSSDSGTNSDYDLGDADLGCGLDSDTVDITAIEAVRDDWFWDQQFFLDFEIIEAFEAKKFIEKEILQLLNCYPAITGNGKYKIIPFKPPIATDAVTTSLTEDTIIGIPQPDLNFAGLINEIEFYYDHDGDDFLTISYTVDAASYAARGNSAAPLRIESKGLLSTHATASRAMHYAELINNRAASVFQRYSVPPVKLPIKAFFSKWIAEAGDIVPVTHSKIANVETGTLGLSAENVEVIKRSVDWKNGTVSFDLQMTGFQRGIYSGYSPYMTVTAGTSGTAFTVSAADAGAWSAGWEATVCNHVGLPVATVTILTANSGTGAVTCDDIGQTPAAGWFVTFADYDSCTADQQKYAFMADASDYLGAADDDAHLITP